MNGFWTPSETRQTRRCQRAGRVDPDSLAVPQRSGFSLLLTSCHCARANVRELSSSEGQAKPKHPSKAPLQTATGLLASVGPPSGPLRVNAFTLPHPKSPRHEVHARWPSAAG